MKKTILYFVFITMILTLPLTITCFTIFDSAPFMSFNDANNFFAN
jgi:hypothetical protein